MVHIPFFLLLQNIKDEANIYRNKQKQNKERKDTDIDFCSTTGDGGSQLIVN